MNSRRPYEQAPVGWRPAAAATPSGTVIYSIGDIHGSSELLRQILATIWDDSRARPARRRVLVFLGDYINRGSDSSVVVDMAMEPGLAGFEVVALKGNNEDLLLRFVAGDLSVGPNWLDYGGTETLASYGLSVVNAHGRDAAALEELRWRSDTMADYGVTSRLPQAPKPDLAQLERLRQDIVAILPRRHMDFLRSLRVAHQEGDYYFVHAGIRPGVPLDKQTDLDRMWIRQRFLESEQDHGVIIVHGHSIFTEPQLRPNRIGIDTGAYKSGVLTCLVLDGTDREFLQT